MPLPSSIPTSFVPHPGGQQVRQYRSDFGSALSVLAYLVLAVMVVASIGVFVYNRILISEQASKDAELSKAESSIDSAAVQNFIRLRNRLSASTGLLDNHVSISNFFTLLENILPSTTRFTSLHIIMDTKGTIAIQGAGMAQSFNALAAASNAFAKDGRIKNAIFSNISVTNNGAVSFKLAATLDPSLVAYTPAAPAILAPVDTGAAPVGMSPATTTSTTTP